MAILRFESNELDMLIVSDGIDVDSVDVYYYQSTSNTELIGGEWSTVCPEYVDGTYMWSKTITTLSSGGVTETDPVCITGNTGRSIVSIVEEYNISADNKVTPVDGWSEEVPEWTEGMYIWTRSRITYQHPDGIEYSTPVCSREWEVINTIITEMSGVRSDVDAINKSIEDEVWKDTIITVTDGNGNTISESIESFIANHTINLEGISNTVSRMQTDIDGVGQRLSTAETSIKQNAENIELKASQSYVDNMSIGGRNFISQSKINTTSSTYGFGLRTTTEKLEPNTEYVLSVSGRTNNDKTSEDGKYLRTFIYTTDWSFNVSVSNKNTEDTVVVKSFVTPSDINEKTVNVCSYYYPSASEDGIEATGTCTVNWYKLEKGNKNTDWSPAPEDMENRIDAAEASIQVNANAITSKVSKGSVSSEISQEAEKVTIKGNRLVVEADNFKLKENGDLEVSGKYTAEFVRRYDKNTFTAEEVTRTRKIVAGYQYDDVTEEELAKYDLTGDGLKLNDALMIARIADGSFFDWIEYGTRVEINPLSNAAALNAKAFQRTCVNGVVNERISLGETKISGAGMKTPTVLADSYETAAVDEFGEIIEWSGTNGHFCSEDGKNVTVTNGLVTIISGSSLSVHGLQRMIAVDGVYGYFDAGAYATVEKTTVDSISSDVHKIALAYRNAGYTIVPYVLSGVGDYGNAHYYNVYNKTFNDDTYTVELGAKVTNTTNSTRTIKVLFRIGLFAYKS